MQMYQTIEQMKRLVETARGQREGDLLIKNAQILDVFTERLFNGAILIKDGKIAAITNQPHHHAKEVFDAQNMIALPGFMDAHFHLDFPLVTPAELAKAIVPHGTTAMLCEILDFAAINGLEGVKGLIRNADKLPYRCFLAAPGKVAPKMIAEEMLKWEQTVCLGEMAQPLLESCEPDELHKIELTKQARKVLSGHAINREEKDMDIFGILGFDDEHNTDTYDEALARMRFGMKKIVRLNGAYNAIASIIGGAIKNNIPTDEMLFAVDDIYVHDIFRHGHIDTMIQQTIEVGLNPIKAIKIATINPARHFRIDHLIGSITPGRFADMVFIKELNQIQPIYVFQNGKLVAEENKLISPVHIDYSDMIEPRAHGIQNLREENFFFTPEEAKTTLFHIADGKKIHAETFDARLRNTSFFFDEERDIVPYYKIQRYKGPDSRKYVKCFFHGLGLKDGAMATTFEQRGAAIGVLGTNPKDILCASQEADKHPGSIVLSRDGKVIEMLSLPIGASISNMTAETVAEQLNKMQDQLAKMGCQLSGALMRIYFFPFLLQQR